MSRDVREQYENTANDLDAQMRLVCDFVAGMTDRYAILEHERLFDPAERT